MLTTREVASLLLLAAFVVPIVAVPNMRRSVVPAVPPLLRAALNPKLLLVYVLVVVVSAASTVVAWWLGLWSWSLIKDAVILTGAVALPMTFRSFGFKSGGELAHRLVRNTFSLAAIMAFYLGTAPLPLAGELLVQAIATGLVVFQAFSRTDAEYRLIEKSCDVLLGAIGVFLLIWTTAALVTPPPDWPELVRSLLFSFWLPLSLLPFFYAFGFYAVTERVRAGFRAKFKPFTPRLMLAFMIGTRLRLSLLAQFTGRYSGVADARGFRDGLRRMADFRADLRRRQDEENERAAVLKSNTGWPGLDEHGLHVDRREFDLTKKRLNWIWTCQNGQFERQGGRYWDHLTDLIVDAERHDLPEDHGFVVETADAGQVWRSWRRGPGGAVLGAGGASHRSQFYFQGEQPPDGWPGSSAEWVDAARNDWPPDWNKDDRSRL